MLHSIETKSCLSFNITHLGEKKRKDWGRRREERGEKGGRRCDVRTLLSLYLTQFLSWGGVGEKTVP